MRNPYAALLVALFAGVFPVVKPGEAGKAVPVDLVFTGGGDKAAGDGAQGGGTATVLEQGTFPDDRAGAEFGNQGAVDPDAEYPSSSR